MKQFRFTPRSRAASACGTFAAIAAALAVSPALAAASTTPAQVSPVAPVAPVTPQTTATWFNDAGLAWGQTSSCSAPALYQPFAAWRDSGDYTLAPGQSADGFDGTGWTLSNGASIQSTQLQDGSAGQVLDLPSGAVAISPEICVSHDYPTARTMVRDVAGGQGVQVFVAYAGTKTEDQPQGTGQVHGQQASWSLSAPFGVKPGPSTGWQLMRFTLVGSGRGSDAEVYDFYVDPHMKG